MQNVCQTTYPTISTLATSHTSQIAVLTTKLHLEPKLLCLQYPPYLSRFTPVSSGGTVGLTDPQTTQAGSTTPNQRASQGTTSYTFIPRYLILAWVRTNPGKSTSFMLRTTTRLLESFKVWRLKPRDIDMIRPPTRWYYWHFLHLREHSKFIGQHIYPFYGDNLPSSVTNHQSINSTPTSYLCALSLSLCKIVLHFRPQPSILQSPSLLCVMPQPQNPESLPGVPGNPAKHYLPTN